ncbi:hypothetical protein Gohar_026908 [Gossypium harknessii]|uniref:MADS-box domain-containing protein n=1 Tax=Gossypium harknessii TaxID=34285 RepID=A0A7J9HTS8_9ROSI|nr:hypothetical protein [Gossypium harknessii]
MYKKISELYTLCGGKILFIIFSPTSKRYLFDHPSVEYVAKRFLIPSQPLNKTIHAPVEAYRKGRINLHVQDFNEIND